MNILLAVVDDLFWFAAGALFGIRRSRPEAEPVMYLEQKESPDLIEGAVATATELHPTDFYEGVTPQKNTVMYTASIDMPLRSEPTLLRDTVLGTVPYGSMVMVLETKNGWAKVQNGRRSGWIETRDLADRAAYVLPQFTVGEGNAGDDPNTVRLRTMIRDEFSAGLAGLPLQAHEYILYRLYRKDVHVDWPDTRPRTPGKWAEMLANTKGVSVSNMPAEQSVMEMTYEGERGHLAFVEAVFPDGAIQVSEANWPEQGIYNERVLPEAEWQALKPQFITFS